MTCPAGEVTADARPTKDHKGRSALLFVVDAGGCAACPLRPECTSAVAGRTIMVGVHEARMANARAAQLDPKIIAMLRLRAKVERKIDHLQDLGLLLPSPSAGHSSKTCLNSRAVPGAMSRDQMMT